MMFKITRKAHEDIEAIWAYTCEMWSIQQAERYYNLIIDEIEYLARQPLSGNDYSHVRKNYRCSKVKSHVIFYRVNSNKNEIEIIRVLHQRMDIENRLIDE